MHSIVYGQSCLQLLARHVCGLGAQRTTCRAHSDARCNCVDTGGTTGVCVAPPVSCVVCGCAKSNAVCAHPLLPVLLTPCFLCAAPAAAAVALQAWLEVAWQAGFDPGGAAMFGAAVQCSRKWIGTTEAAALLRYFGCRALIVDFYGERDRVLGIVFFCQVQNFLRETAYHAHHFTAAFQP
jgi:hypothetical protein